MEYFYIELQYVINKIDADIQDLEYCIKKYSDFFYEANLGIINSFQVNIKLHNDEAPIISKAQPVLYDLRAADDKEIDHLVSNRTIESVEVKETTEWVSPVAKKCSKEKWTTKVM